MKIPTGSSPDSDGDGVPEIQWGDPPPPVQGGGRPLVWMEKVAPLLDRPCEWAKIADYGDDLRRASVTVSNLKRHIRLPAPAARWEFVSRQGGVWARYLGDGPAGVTPGPSR